MNIFRAHPRLIWLSSLLAMLLQRAPLVRQSALAEFSLRMPLGHVLRALVPAAAVSSVVHAQTGATQFTTNPGSPVSGRVGQSFTMVFSVTGANKPAGSYGVDGPLPNGLVVTGPSGQVATINGSNRTLNASSGILSGVPTQAGTFGITVRAWEFANRTGDTVPSIPVLVIISEATTAPAFSQQPSSITGAFGGSVSFTVAVTGSPAPTLQWRKGTTPISGATSATLTLSDLTLADAGSYDCVATNSVSSVTSSAAILTVNPPPPPAINFPPVGSTSLVGSAAFFSVDASGQALTFQWLKGATEIPGATTAGLLLTPLQLSDAGNYAVRITNPGGSVTSTAAALTVVTSGASRLVNLSTRAQVGTGSDILIPGLVISGSGAKSLLVRAVGPRLADFGVGGVLADPRMDVLRSDQVPAVLVATNDDWGLAPDQPGMESTRLAVGAFPLAPSTKDASLLISLSAGPHTIPTAGVNNGTGVALVEVYDADTGPSASTLTNISARALVGTGGDVLIPGFVISGDVALTLLIRAIGPTLGGFGVGGVLADPVMILRRPVPGTADQVVVAQNDDWEQGNSVPLITDAFVRTGAFGLPGGTKDAVLLVSLMPGAYTVQVAGKNNGTGVALVELYLVPQ